MSPLLCRSILKASSVPCLHIFKLSCHRLLRSILGHRRWGEAALQCLTSSWLHGLHSPMAQFKQRSQTGSSAEESPAAVSPEHRWASTQPRSQLSTTAYSWQQQALAGLSSLAKQSSGEACPKAVGENGGLCCTDSPNPSGQERLQWIETTLSQKLVRDGNQQAFGSWHCGISTLWE